MRSLFRFLFGRPIANEEHTTRKIGVLEGVPAMGLDALGSSSYGPEAALTVLLPLAAAGVGYLGIVMLPILLLLAIMQVSYRQTIRAYPTNGGGYTVSKLNLGTNAGLLAASALMIDYVLNVAVGISAGVGAFVSAVPSLHSHMLLICLAILALLTVMNLRGTGDAGRAWALPTYLFIASFVLIIAVGVYRSLSTQGQPSAVMPPPQLQSSAVEAVSLWLLMKSFAAGCTAMTGVEAVSNGVGAFREPVVVRAHRTLAILCATLALLLGGIAYLVRGYGIVAMDQTQPGYQSVLSQLAGAVVGHGIFYYVAIGSALSVLCLSANTSFVDFPRVCRLVASDDYLPRVFANVGRRLVFSVGILYLAVAAGLLLIVFGGITDRLIPLFAIGAFLTFTLSQLGMVFHWHRERSRGQGRERHKHLGRLIINAIGAATTSVALLIIIAAKFAEGAWIVLIAIPCVIYLLKRIHRYYSTLEARLQDQGQLDLQHNQPPIALVAIEGWNRLADHALLFATRITSDVIALHFTELEGPDVDEHSRRLRERWKYKVEAPARAAGRRPPQLVLTRAPYRRMAEPLLQFIADLERKEPAREIAVLLPEVVKKHWWQYILHGYRVRRLHAALLSHGGSRVVVVEVPWYLEEPRPAGRM